MIQGVCHCISLFVTRFRRANTAERIEVLFGVGMQSTLCWMGSRTLDPRYGERRKVGKICAYCKATEVLDSFATRRGRHVRYCKIVMGTKIQRDKSHRGTFDQGLSTGGRMCSVTCYIAIGRIRCGLRIITLNFRYLLLQPEL